MGNKVIFLIDMNSFFASVHQAMEPALRQQPVIVCGDPAKRHGIVLAASYPAKAYGVKTGMTVNEAKRLCPQGVFVAPRYHHYFEFSTRILNILRDFSPLVEPFSIDEAFVDVTGCAGLFGTPREMAVKIKERIKNEVGVTCSVGIGPNKLLAKMAADLQKPDGLVVLNHSDVPSKLWPLPVRKLFGVGSRYEKHFSRLNIKTIGDLANYPVEILRSKFGLMGEVLHLSAKGIDHSPVDPSSLEQVKSIGNQITLPRDYCGFDEIGVVILELAEQVCYRARMAGYLGKTIALTLRDHNLISSTHSQTLAQPSNITNEIYQGAVALMHKHWPNYIRVRSVALTLSNLTDNYSRQLSMLGDTLKEEQADRACDAIKNRWGYHAIKRAVSLTERGVFYDRKKNR
nr:DNA polymerase IV [Desulfofalx alkaliphila]